LPTIRPASGAELPMMAGVAEVLALIGEMEQANQIARGFRVFPLDAAISRFRQAPIQWPWEMLKVRCLC
jgi:hypothetical protein